MVVASSEKPDNDVKTKEPPVPIAWVPIAPDGGWGWVVVLGAFLVHVFTDGIVYSFGVVVVELLDTFQEGRGLTSWIVSILVGLTLGTGPFASAFTNRYGCRVTTIVGALIASFGCAISFFADSILFLSISIGIIVGVGFGFTYCPTIIMVTRYFEEKRAFATGLAVCGAGFGTFVFAPFTRYLIDEYTWRGAFLIYSGIVLNCAVCGAVFRPLEFRPVYEDEVDDEDDKCERKESLDHFNDEVVLERTMSDAKRPQKLEPPVKSLQNSVNRVFHSVTHIHLHPSTERNRANTADKSDSLALGLNAPHYRNRRHRRHRGTSESGGYLGMKDVFYTSSLRNVVPQTGRFDAHALDLYRSITSLHSMDTRKPAAEHGKVPEFDYIPENEVVRVKVPERGLSQPSQDADRTGWWADMCSVCKTMSDVSVLKEPLFLLFALSNFFTSIGFNAPLIFLPDKADQQLGVSKQLATWTLSVYGISNTVGRIAVGYFSDKRSACGKSTVQNNRLWTYNISLTLCGILTIFSFLCTNLQALLVYSAIFGFLLSTYICLTSVILVDLLGIDKLTNSFGLLMLVNGLASFIGPPVTGFIVDYTGNYDHAFYFAGICLGISGLMLYCIPWIKPHPPTADGGDTCDQTNLAAV